MSPAEVLEVHVIPSGEVITLFPVPVAEIATNKPNCGDHEIDFQLLVFGAVLPVHVAPSVEVIIRVLIAPVIATATNKPNSGAQTTSDHEVTGTVEVVLNVHVLPSEL